MFTKTLFASSVVAAIILIPMTARAEFRATDLYQLCKAGLSMRSDTMNDELACFNFLNQVWSRGFAAGQICSSKPVSNGEMAFAYTLNLWRMPPEYLSTRADVAASAVFSASFPCVKPAPASARPPAGSAPSNGQSSSPASPSHAEMDKGWWVVVASFSADNVTEQQREFQQVNDAAARCGLRTFNDLSAKFTGFRPGYNVFVVGAYRTRSEAEHILLVARTCLPEAYLKYGQWLGE
jgi:hypothetical protein